MNLDDNITQRWDEIRLQAVQDWKAEIRERLGSELEGRGITIQSSSIAHRGEVFQHIMAGQALNGADIEITVDSKHAFQVRVIHEDEVYHWPTTPMSTYDRKNYTIRHLLDWLDTRLWKE